MTRIRAREAVVAEFLRNALADEALGVSKLEAMARAAGLLGEGERITQAKLFRRAKRSLGIRSIRDGFGPGGRWAWELPRGRDEPAATTSGMSQPIRVARRVPADWIEGVGRLDCQRPMTGVPRHRWCRFVDDCNSFARSGLSAPQTSDGTRGLCSATTATRSCISAAPAYCG